MTDLKTVIFSSFNEQESEALKLFKREAFYHVGEDIDNYDFWQQFYNLFFVYHFDIENGETFSSRRSLNESKVHLFVPSRFARLKGTDFFSEEKLHIEEEVTWYKEREMITACRFIFVSFSMAKAF